MSIEQYFPVVRYIVQGGSYLSLRPRVRDYVISIHLFKAHARSATNDSDIARNIHEKLCSIKSLVYASVIARAFNRVAGNIVHFKYC